MGVKGRVFDQLERSTPSSPRPVAGSFSEPIPHSVERPDVADQLVSLVAPDSYAADQYRALRHTVEWLRKESGLRVLAVTSPAPGDGKTVTSLNLAGAMAQSPDTRVLVVDADLRRPSVGAYLGLDAHSSLGLGDALRGPEYRLDYLVRRLDRFNLWVLPAGSPRNSPYELLNSSRLDTLLEEMRALYDFVVIDTPPIVSLPDCRLIGRGVDGFLLIVTAHKTPRELAIEAVNLLNPAKVIGIVFNGDDRPGRHYGYYRYYHADATQSSWWRRALSRSHRK
jgi:capsular exopolysaccharide synthesis family protein